MEPNFRCGTRKAIEELSIEINIPFNESNQDWSYTNGNYLDIEKYLSHYITLLDEDKKFVLMEVIIQSIEDQENEKLFDKYCILIKPILELEFDLHEYTIHYWCCFFNDNLKDCFNISNFMREIWNTKNLEL
jgi:hypothetical protein